MSEQITDYCPIDLVMDFVELPETLGVFVGYLERRFGLSGLTREGVREVIREAWAEHVAASDEADSHA